MCTFAQLRPTALFYACQQGQMEMLRFLVETAGKVEEECSYFLSYDDHFVITINQQDHGRLICKTRWIDENYISTWSRGDGEEYDTVHIQ